MISGSARGGLAGALRTWRTRRRVSQLELAVWAGTTQRHVSFIESGRSTPGRAMIIRLAESLEVPIRERNELLLAAGFAPAYPQGDLDDPQLAPVRTALLMTGPIQPGLVLKIPEADLYGLGDLVLRVTEVRTMQQMSDGDWLKLKGVQLAWNGTELREREVLARLSGLKRRPGA
jgi:transcriptional regulator with XRE-family HTH domain